MKTYSVTITRQVYEEATIEVDAESPHQACKIGRESAGALRWERLDATVLRTSAHVVPEASSVRVSSRASREPQASGAAPTPTAEGGVA